MDEKSMHTKSIN